MVSEEEILKIATLARLKFTSDEVQSFARRFTNVVDMIQEIQQLDCTNVEPLASVCEQGFFTREDIVTEQDLGAALFSNAPGQDSEFAKEIKCFIVPKVVE